MAISNRGIGVAKLLFGLAVIFFLAGIVVTFQYLSTADERAIQNLESVDVIVAVEAIPKGTSLFDAEISKFIETQTFPAKAVPLNSIQDINASNGDLLSRAGIAPGQILVNSLFADREVPSIDLEIPAGFVAVTVQMEYATRVASFIKPGVDVAVYSTKLDNKNEKAVTTLLFKSARVLAVGTETKVTAQAVDKDISDFITLSIRFDEASKLINATKVSSLYLALLNESSLIGSQNVQK